MKKIRVLSLIVVICMCLGAFTGCSKNNNETEPVNKEIEMQETSSAESKKEEEIKSIINPLTGEDGYEERLLKTRPVAVMINNISAALPQRGIADADIIYEMQVEGPITRLMAVFSDYKSMPDIGSIRSARHDYVELLKPLNAIYLHFGGSTAGKQAIKDNNIDDIDGLFMYKTAFYKDEQRAKTKSAEHCWFSNGELLQAGIDKKGFDISTEPLNSIFNFSDVDENVMDENEDAKSAVSVKASITNSTKATFTYDEQTKLYSKQQNGKLHIDTNKNEPIKCTNVFLMYTKVGYLPDNYHKEIDLSNGSGYYISNGKAIEVTFKKPSIGDTIKVYSKDGTEIKVNAGKSYFCIADNSQKGKLTIQ